MKITITQKELDYICQYIADMDRDPCRCCLQDKASCTSCPMKNEYRNKIMKYENSDTVELYNEPHILKYFELMKRVTSKVRQIIILKSELYTTLDSLISIGSNIIVENEDGSKTTLDEVAKPNIPDKLIKKDV